MDDSQQNSLSGVRPEHHRSGPGKASRTFLFAFTFLGIFSTAAGFQVGRFISIHTGAQPANISVAPRSSASSAPTQAPDPVKAEAEELSHLSPQQQAEHLLEHAIHHQESSLTLIRQDVDSWRGHLQSTDQLFDLVRQAMNSEDLRVRSAALEIDLVASNLPKSPQSVAHLLQQIRNNPADRSLALWRLGSLGNRGVQPKIVLTQLRNYAHDPSEDTRYWAVEGLAMLGSNDAVSPLLDRFAHDASSRVRQRAAYALAQDGMLTPEQRFAVVPDLFNLLDDDELSPATRNLVYATLRLITGAKLGNNTNAWLQWWAHHGATRSRHSHPDALFHA